MKKRIALISVILTLILFGYVACTKSTTVPLSKETAQDQMKSTETMKPLGEGSTSPTGGEQPANQTNVNITTKSDNIYTDAQKQKTLNVKPFGEGSTSPAGGEQPANQTNVNIITKSDNIYTDAQKQEILNQLTEEIDKLIQSINNLEDAQDSELIFD